MPRRNNRGEKMTIGQYMLDVAKHYWGEPTKVGHEEIFWGSHNGRKIHAKRGTWFDFEENTGGGVIDLIRHKEGAMLKPMPQFLQDTFGINSEMERQLKPKEYLAKAYDYCDEYGSVSYQVQRFEPKRFIQRSYVDGSWKEGRGAMDDVMPLPYHLPEIIDSGDRVVFIVEGEKCVEALREYKCIATCNHGGANNWKPALNPWFGDKNVVLLPDNDEAGSRHADKVAANIGGLVASIKRIDLPGLPPKGDICDWLKAGNTMALLKKLVDAAPEYVVPEVDPEPEETEEDVFELYTLRELRAMPPIDWVVEGLLTRHGFSVLYGEPGSGKSFAALDIALSVANGLPWQGKYPTTQGSVLYIAGEGVGGLGKRIKGWEAWNGLMGVDAPFYVLPTAVRFREHEEVQKLARTIDSLKQNFSLVIVDTVARALLGGDENSATDMGLFIDACDYIKKYANCALLAIHHSGKDVARGLRGSTALLGGVDASIRVKHDNNQMDMQVEKQKDAEPVQDLVLDMIEVAMIDDGTIVLQLSEDDKCQIEKLPETQKLAWDALINGILDAQSRDTSVKKISTEKWNEAHKNKCPNETPQKRAYARNALQNRRLVYLEGGKVWPDYEKMEKVRGM